MTEWYRNTYWNDEIEAMFFAKLDKARSQRDQYIVLQAFHLSESHPKVALRLIDFYYETRTEDFHDGRADQVRASAQFALGGYAEALDNYLKLLKGRSRMRTFMSDRRWSSPSSPPGSGQIRITMRRWNNWRV